MNKLGRGPGRRKWQLAEDYEPVAAATE